VRRKRAPVSPLGAVLKNLGAIRVPPSVEASPVAVRDWEAAVGSRIAMRAKPTRLERGVLHVTAATSTWAQELSLLADAIVFQLRGRGVDVHSLRFHVGVVEAPARPATRGDVRRAPAPATLPKALADEVARVADDDLRAAIAEAAAKNLGWQAARPQSGSGANENENENASDAATSKPRGARAPQSAAPENAPPVRSSSRSREGRRGKT
jgi:hypothetical protein